MTALSLVFVIFLASSTQAQTTSLDCVPPETQASAPLLQDFGPEIRSEFSAYFNAAQRYIRCLDAASQSAHGEVRDVLDAHRRLFPNG